MENIFRKNNKIFATFTILLFFTFCGCGQWRKNIRSNDLGIVNSSINVLIDNLLNNGHQVSLFIVGGQVLGADKLPDDEWKNRLLIFSENSFLKSFGNRTNFAIVTRNNLNYSVEEFTLNQSGLTSDSTRLKIGALTGATHILIVEATFIYGNWKHNNYIFWKLIDLQSGKVLAIDRGDLWLIHLFN